MKIFVLCGEASADLYAWLLLKDTSNEISGIGGEKLNDIVKGEFMDAEDFNVLGIMPGQIVRSSLRLRHLKNIIIKSRPDIFMPVSYPGLNLPLSRMIKKAGTKVYYLLPPQIWAWAGFRKRFLRDLDLVISLFPFEMEYFKDINSIYIGNPLIDFLQPYRKIRPITDLIGLMPGSRPEIIKRHLGFLVRVAETLKDRYRFRIFTKGKMEDLPECIEVYNDDRYKGMRECSKIIVKLGTASLEAAILGIPQVAFFIPSKTDYLLRPFIKTDEFSIVNRVLGRKEIRYFISPDVKTMISSLEGLDKRDLFPELKKILKFDREKLARIGLV